MALRKKKKRSVCGTTVIAFAVHGMGASRRVPGDEDDDTVARTGCRQPARALSACVHAGKVEEGLRLAAPLWHERYNCTIDMFCRVGRAA